MSSLSRPSHEATNALRQAREGLPVQAMSQLAEMGHPIVPVSGSRRFVFGRGQIIQRDPHSGVLCGGSDPRADGCVMTL